MSFILEVATGIVLAYVAIALAPVVAGGVLGALAHAATVLTKSRRGLVVPVSGQSPRHWVTTSLLQLGGVGVALGGLVLVGYLSRTHVI